MTPIKTLLMTIFVSLFTMTSAIASDFDWLSNLKIKAEADSSGYRMQLATRFHIGDAEVRAVIGNVDSPSDAYMVFRMGELTHKPIQEVLHVYSSNKNRGWGVMAKQLGIKPGSREFHALKRGHDLYHDDHDNGSMHAKKGNGKHGHNPGKKDKGKWK
ncbi:hypothetical protein [Kaarinaea lacus]